MAVVERTVDLIGDEAFCDLIISKEIPEGQGYPTDFYDDTIKQLKQYAFKYMKGMTSLKLTEVTSISQEAIVSCQQLLRVELPKLVTIPSSSIRDNTNLLEIVCPMATSTGSYAFAYDTALESINLPNMVTIAEGTFTGCRSVTSIFLPKARSIANYGFQSCPLVEQIDLPSIQTIGANFLSSESQIQVLNIGPYITSIHASAFYAARNIEFVINMAVGEGSVAGAPWGAANAVINYDVPYCGTVPMPA